MAYEETEAQKLIQSLEIAQSNPKHKSCISRSRHEHVYKAEFKELHQHFQALELSKSGCTEVYGSSSF